MHEREHGVTLELFDRMSQLKRHLVSFINNILCNCALLSMLEVLRKMVHDRHTLVIEAQLLLTVFSRIYCVMQCNKTRGKRKKTLNDGAIKVNIYMSFVI